MLGLVVQSDPVTPTQAMTQTVALWITADGTDVGSYAVSVLQGFQVLSFLLVIVLAQYLAIRLWPS